MVAVAIVVIVVATGGNDSTKTTTTATTAGPGAIENPATVTGITSIASAQTTQDVGAAAIGILQRSLESPGAFDCTTTGTWRPYAELQLALSVGEPAAGSSCSGNVLDLAYGSCTVATCTEVPADWQVHTRSGVPPESLLLIVAPNTASTAEYVCVKGLVPQPKQVLLRTTTIEQACPADGSVGSIDLPYVPPATSDIYVPTAPSVDLPAG